MTDSFREKLIKGAWKLGVDINSVQVDDLYCFYNMIIKKNEFINLTSITREDDVIYKHFLDSLCLVKVPEATTILESGYNLIDVGTGAGFPGIVLKIVYNKIDMTLLDSTKKKLVFLDEVIETLKLRDVRTIHGRAEDIGANKAYREKFDLVTSRAVAFLPVLLEYTLPFLKTGGFLVAYKTAECDEEILVSKNALSILGGEIAGTYTFVIPETNIARSLIVVKKVCFTPLKYPRRVGMPRKYPL